MPAPARVCAGLARTRGSRTALAQGVPRAQASSKAAWQRGVRTASSCAHGKLFGLRPYDAARREGETCEGETCARLRARRRGRRVGPALGIGAEDAVHKPRRGRRWGRRVRRVCTVRGGAAGHLWRCDRRHGGGGGNAHGMRCLRRDGARACAQGGGGPVVQRRHDHGVVPCELAAESEAAAGLAALAARCSRRCSRRCPAVPASARVRGIIEFITANVIKMTVHSTITLRAA